MSGTYHKKVGRKIAVLAKTFAPFPRQSIFHIIRILIVDAPPHRQGIENMHWLQMFLLTWLSFGLTTVVFMFWLCKRTAAALNESGTTTSITPHRPEFSAKKLSSELRSA